MTAIDLATAYANAGKALLDLADALTADEAARAAYEKVVDLAISLYQEAQ